MATNSVTLRAGPIHKRRLALRIPQLRPLPRRLRRRSHSQTPLRASPRTGCHSLKAFVARQLAHLSAGEMTPATLPHMFAKPTKRAAALVAASKARTRSVRLKIEIQVTTNQPRFLYVNSPL